MQLSPRSAELRIIRAEILASGEGANQARSSEDYNEAIRCNPNYADAYFERVNVHAGQENEEKRIADYTEAIRRNPMNTRFYYSRKHV